LTGQEIEQ